MRRNGALVAINRQREQMWASMGFHRTNSGGKHGWREFVTWICRRYNTAMFVVITSRQAVLSRIFNWTSQGKDVNGGQRRMLCPLYLTMIYNLLQRDLDCRAKIAAIDECIKKIVLFSILIISFYERISSSRYVTISDSLWIRNDRNLIH